MRTFSSISAMFNQLPCFGVSVETAKPNSNGLIIEFHYSGQILKELHYDSIYHEHLCYFSTKSISYLLALYDLVNNPFKQGMYSPGSSIPIVSLERGIQMNPDLIFILAWNFRDEIVKECRTNGYKGEFLVAFPQDLYCFKD